VRNEQFLLRPLRRASKFYFLDLTPLLFLPFPGSNSAGRPTPLNSNTGMYILEQIRMALPMLSSDRIRMLFASASERYISFYFEFSRREESGDPDAIRIALDFAWQSIGNKNVNRATIASMRGKVTALSPSERHNTIFADHACSVAVCILASLDMNLTYERASELAEYIIRPIETTITGDLLGLPQPYPGQETWLRTQMERDNRFAREAKNIAEDLSALGSPEMDDASLAALLKSRSDSRRWSPHEILRKYDFEC
jgi:Protein of unknown function (DUF416)